MIPLSRRCQTLASADRSINPSSFLQLAPLKQHNMLSKIHVFPRSHAFLSNSRSLLDYKNYRNETHHGLLPCPGSQVPRLHKGLRRAFRVLRLHGICGLVSLFGVSRLGPWWPRCPLSGKKSTNMALLDLVIVPSYGHLSRFWQHDINKSPDPNHQQGRSFVDDWNSEARFSRGLRDVLDRSPVDQLLLTPARLMGQKPSVCEIALCMRITWEMPPVILWRGMQINCMPQRS